MAAIGFASVSMLDTRIWIVKWVTRRQKIADNKVMYTII
jgi:hypothetical protein